MSLILISNKSLKDIESDAKTSPRRRKHLNLHKSYFDPCQRLFNAIHPESYIRPHRHDGAQGSETLIAIRGLMALVVFDDNAEISGIHTLGSEKFCENDNVLVGAEIPPGQWHTVVALSETTILLELKAGPFNPDIPKIFASWAPDECCGESQIYLSHLRRKILCEVSL